MQQLLDKFGLILITSILYVSFYFNELNIIYILIAIMLSCINSYFEKDYIRYAVNIIFFIICCISIDYIFFIPLLIYDTFMKKEAKYLLLYFIILLIHYNTLPLKYILFILALCLISFSLKYKTFSIYSLIETNKKIKDDSEELQLLQEMKQKELLEKQDYEIQLARSEERNRIAREIHDSVGHNLSSSLLQIGAMIAINQDNNLKEPLQNMKETLSDGMNSIRTSVHDLHQDTLNLEQEMQKIISQFQFCDINFTYHSTNLMDMKLKYCFINILKEALNNVMKHSNATMVNISFMESQKFYQFIIQDNGTKIKTKEGLGLKSMSERVYSYNGICNITKENGFKIFINIPKEDN